MKKRLNELDVDFIGGNRPLTKEEEEAISKFLKSSKEKRRAPLKTRTFQRSKVNA